MSELSAGICEPCRLGAPLLTEEDLANLKPQIPDWEVVEVGGIRQLTRQYSFKNFVIAMAFANKVGDEAEKEGHHPAILVEWGKTSVTWWTHKIKGLHKNDVIMAAKTDRIYSD